MDTAEETEKKLLDLLETLNMRVDELGETIANLEIKMEETRQQLETLRGEI